jgi:hypothetical protein
MKKSPTVLKNVFLKSYGALRTFMQNNPLIKDKRGVDGFKNPLKTGA